MNSINRLEIVNSYQYDLHTLFLLNFLKLKNLNYQKKTLF